MSVRVFIDPDTDTVFVSRGESDSEFTVIAPDSEPVITFSLPGEAVPMISEDEVDTESAYEEGYSEGYDSGTADADEGYTWAELEDARSEGYDEGYEDGRNSAAEEKDPGE